MKDTVRLGRIVGVPVGLNWSLVAIVVLFAFGLADNRFPYDAPGYGREAYVIAGALTAVALLGAVLLHELGHAVVARRSGLKVEGITLSWMGGITRISGDSRSPRREMWVAAVGPLVSLAVGAILIGVRYTAVHVGTGRLALSAITWLAIINVVLAVFNLIPAAPLDGGRILHAAVWGVTHNRWRATLVTARAGMLLAAVILALGMFELVGRGGELDGAFILVLGWWLLVAAREEEQQAAVHRALGGVLVHQVMRPVGSAPGWLTTEEFLHRYVEPKRDWVWLLEDFAGGYSGVLAGDALLALPRHWATVRPSDVAVPVAAAAATEPYEGILDALERTGGRQVLLVVADEHTVGAVLPADIDRLVRTGRRPVGSGALAAPVR